MRKIFGLVCCAIFSFCFLVPAQEVYEIYEEETTRVNPATNETTTTTVRTIVATTPFTIREFSHWSVTLDAGFNVFQGDMENDYKVLYKEPFKHWSLGGTVEYTVNPMYSLGIGYSYSHVRARDKRSNADDRERGRMESDFHHIYPFIGINLLNFPVFERNKKWDFWLTIGVGGLHYDSELFYEYVPTVTPQFTEEEWYTPGNPGYQTESKWTVTVPLGFELAYNITDQFVIGLKYRLFFHTSDALEGGTKLRDQADPYGRKNYTYVGSANDALSQFLLTFRWDIAGKDKVHIRNASWSAYSPKPVPDPRVDRLMKKMDELEDKLENIDMTPVIIPMEGGDCGCNDIPLAVYFAFDKTNLDKEALQTISQVARIMYENPDYRVEIRGYTDIKGSDAYNDKLSQRRADVIKNELIKVFNIAPERITANGEGKAKEPSPNDSKYHPINRRCDFFFIK